MPNPTEVHDPRSGGWVAVQMVGGAVTSASVPVLTAGEVSARLATASPAAPSDNTRSARGRSARAQSG